MRGLIDRIRQASQHARGVLPDLGQAMLTVVVMTVVIMVAIPAAADLSSIGEAYTTSFAGLGTQAAQAATAGLVDVENRLSATPGYFDSASGYGGYCSSQFATTISTYSVCQSGSTPGTSNPAFVSYFDGTSGSTQTKSCAASSSTATTWVTTSGTSSGENAGYQYEVDSHNVYPGGSQLAYIYVMGRAGKTGNYECHETKSAVNVDANSASVTNTPSNPAVTTPSTPTGTTTSGTATVTLAGAAGGSGTSKCLLWFIFCWFQVSGGTGGDGDRMTAEFNIPAGTALIPLIGNAGSLNGSVSTSGSNSAGAAGTGAQSGGGATVLCAEAASATGSGLCSSSTWGTLVSCGAISSAPPTTGPPCLLAVAGAGGGAGLSEWFTSGGDGGNAGETTGSASSGSSGGCPFFCSSGRSDGAAGGGGATPTGAGSAGGGGSGDYWYFDHSHVSPSGTAGSFAAGGAGATATASGGWWDSWSAGGSGGGGGGGYYGGGGGGSGFDFDSGGGGGGGSSWIDSLALENTTVGESVTNTGKGTAVVAVTGVSAATSAQVITPTTVSLYCGSTGTGCPASSAATCATLYDLASSSDCTYVTQSCGSSSSAMAVPSGASSATFYAYGGGGGSGMDENEYPDGAAAVFPAGGAGSKVSIATSVTNGATYYANVGCGGAAAGETGCSSSNGDGYCNSSSTSGGAGWAAGGPGGTGKYELKSTTHATDGYSGAGGGASAVCTISCSSAASPLIVGAGGGGGAEEVDDLVNAGAGGAADGGSGYLGASVYTGGTGATATTISTTNSHCTSSAYTCWDAGGAGGGGGYQGGTSGAAGLPLSCNSISTSGCPSTSTSITVPASNPGGGYGGQSYAAAGGTISAGAGASGGTTTGTSAATGANGYVLVVWTFTTSATAYCTSTSCPSAATCQSITGVSNCDVTTNASESCSANGFTIVPPSSPVAASSGTFYTFGGGGGSGLDENEFADGSAAAYPPGGAGSKAISGAVTVNSGTDFSGNIGCGGGAEGESCTVDGDCTNGTISGGTGWASGGAGAVGTYRLKTTTDSSDGNSGGGGGATGACVETSTPTASCSSSGMDAMEVVAAGGGGGAEEVDSSINTGTGGTADAGSGYEGSSTYTGAAGTTATTISTNGSNSKCTTTTYTCWDAGGGGGGGGYPGGTGGTAGLPLSCNSISTSGCPSTSTQITVPTANPTGGSGGESNGSTVTAGGGAAGGASSGTTAPVGKNGYIIVVWNYAESTVVSLYCDGTGSSACPASSAATCATWAGLPAASDCNYYSSTSTYACGDSFAITPPAGFTTGTVDVYGGGGGDGTDMFGTYDGSGASYPNGGNGSVESTTITNTTYYGDIGCGGAGGTQSCLPVGNAAGCPSSTPTTTAGYAPGGSGGQGYYNCYDYIFIICPQNTDGNAGAGGGASALCTATCITGSTPLVVAAGGGGGSELTAGKFYTSAVNGTPADDSANTYGSSVSNGTSVPPGTFPNYPPYLIWNAAGGGGGGGYQYGVGQNYATNGLSEVTCIFNGCNANSPTSPNGGIQSPGGGGGQSFPATGSGLTAGGGASGGTGGSGSVNGSNGYIVVYWGGTPGHAAESTPPVHYATCAGGSTWTTLTAGSGGGSNVIPAGTTNFTLGGAAGAIGQDGLSTPGSGQEVQVSVPLTVGQQVTYDTGCSGYGGIGGQGYDATTVTLNLSGGNSGTTFQTSVSGTQTTADENGQGGGGGAATILCLGNSCSTTALCTSAAYALQPTLPCIVAVAAGGGGAGTTSIEESAGQSVNPSCSPTGGNGGDATTVTVANGRGSPGTAGGAGSGVAPGGATEVSLTSGGTGTSATAASVTDPITGWGLVSSGGGGGGIDGGGASSSSTCSGGGGGSSWWWSGTGSLLTSLNSATGFLTYNSFSYDVYATQQTKLGDTSWAS